MTERAAYLIAVAAALLITWSAASLGPWAWRLVLGMALLVHAVALFGAQNLVDLLRNGLLLYDEDP